MSEAALSATFSVVLLVGMAVLFVGWIRLWIMIRDYIGGWLSWLGAAAPLLVIFWFVFYNSFTGG